MGVVKPVMLMLCGLPGSGKSHFAEQLSIKIPRYDVYSSDNLREEMFGDRNDQTHHPEVFAELHKRIKTALINGKNCIYDATNISYKRRTAFLKGLENVECHKFCYIIATPIGKCLANNSKRDNPVPEETIWRMHRNWWTPMLCEGWDAIHLHFWDKEQSKVNGSIWDMVKNVSDWDQHSKYHQLGLGNHMVETANNLNLGIIPSTAALIHDIGKLVTQTFDENGEAHYYNHANVGAYESFFFDNISGQDKLKISAIVNHHMDAFGYPKEKHEKVFGKGFSDMIWEFNKADIKAHSYQEEL